VASFIALTDCDSANVITPQLQPLEDRKHQRTGRTVIAGDHLMCPFQCDECHFVNIHGRASRRGDVKDCLCLLVLRRAILDSFWGRERVTVDATRGEAARYIQAAGLMGVVKPNPRRDPFPIRDEWGMTTAMVLLLRSREKG
jgi:hypothetical protein